MIDLAILTHIGLSEREAQVYYELLRLGEVPIVELVKATGAHPQVVYRALDRLSAQELVLISIKQHRKYVRAESPRKLAAIEHERSQEFKAAIPDLLKLQVALPGVAVKVTKGDDAVPAFRREGYKTLEAGEVYYVLSGAGRYYHAMGKHYGPAEKIRINRGVLKHLVAFKNERGEIERLDVYRALAEFRYVNALFPVPTSINFYRDTTGIIIWAREPVVIRIDDAEVTKSYRDRFMEVWKTAKT